MDEPVVGSSENIRQYYRLEKGVIDVRKRLEELQVWESNWQAQNQELDNRIFRLKETPQDFQLIAQLVSYQEQIHVFKNPIPIVIDPQVINENYFVEMRDQYRGLTIREKRLWMNQLYFVMTPELQRINKKIDFLLRDKYLGHSRNFMLGGLSGMGKTTFFNWRVNQTPAYVDFEYNVIPVIKIDSPIEPRNAKEIYQKIIQSCGKTFFVSDKEDSLFRKALTYMKKCRVQMLIIDEIEHMVKHSVRRKILELTNHLPNLCIAVASCDPEKFTHGDSEIAGRWPTQIDLHPFEGDGLDAFLDYVELFLPLTGSSHLSDRTIIKNNRLEEGPAEFIEKVTGGTLRPMMTLLRDACDQAFNGNFNCITMEILRKAWLHGS